MPGPTVLPSDDDREGAVKRRDSRYFSSTDLDQALKPLRLKHTDVPSEIKYLRDNALHLPEDLTSLEIRQIIAWARIWEHGFALADILLWLKDHEDPAYTYEQAREAIQELGGKLGLTARTLFNYESAARSFPAGVRLPDAPLPRHDKVRVRKPMKLPLNEQLKLLREGTKHHWSDTKLAARAYQRAQELAMPADDGKEDGNRALIARGQALLAFQQLEELTESVRELLTKPAHTPKQAVKLRKEVAALTEQTQTLAELVNHSPVAP